MNVGSWICTYSASTHPNSSAFGIIWDFSWWNNEKLLNFPSSLKSNFLKIRYTVVRKFRLKSTTKQAGSYNVYPPQLRVDLRTCSLYEHIALKKKLVNFFFYRQLLSAFYVWIKSIKSWFTSRFSFYGTIQSSCLKVINVSPLTFWKEIFVYMLSLDTRFLSLILLHINRWQMS